MALKATFVLKLLQRYEFVNGIKKSTIYIIVLKCVMCLNFNDNFKKLISHKFKIWIIF